MRGTTHSALTERRPPRDQELTVISRLRRRGMGLKPRLRTCDGAEGAWMLCSATTGKWSRGVEVLRVRLFFCSWFLVLGSWYQLLLASARTPSSRGSLTRDLSLRSSLRSWFLAGAHRPRRALNVGGSSRAAWIGGGCLPSRCRPQIHPASTRPTCHAALGRAAYVGRATIVAAVMNSLITPSLHHSIPLSSRRGGGWRWRAGARRLRRGPGAGRC